LVALPPNPPFAAHETLCPGCERVENGFYSGELILEGKTTNLTLDAVKELVAEVEDKCWRDNPASRVCSVTEDKTGRIQILTTTEWLAIRISKEIQKVHNGELDTEWSKTDQFVTIRWYRPRK
jgi:hypothetical protein